MVSAVFLRQGANPKNYERSPRNLNVSNDTIQHGVEGLTYLLIFQDSVFGPGFQAE